MKKIAVIFADGMEEIEALTPVDVLRRANVLVDTVSVKDITVTGSHGIKVLADKTLDQVDFSEYDGIVIPGGMPGATNIADAKKVVEALKEFKQSGKLVSAICASPAVVLASNGIIGEEKATCYPAQAFVSALGDNYTGAEVEVFANLITANGPKSAMKFAFAICEYLGVTPKF